MKERKFNNTKILKILLYSVFSCLIIYFIIDYYTCYKALKADSPIKYTVIETMIHRGGRGSYHTMKVLYEEKKYDVNITSSIYKSIELGERPMLFYNADLNLVFDKWHLTRDKRLIGGLFIILILISFLKSKNSYFS